MIAISRSLLAGFAMILVSIPSFGAVLTVGPGGGYSTVSAALATLVGAGGENEIRVAAGVTSGPIAIAERPDHRYRHDQRRLERRLHDPVRRP